MKREVAVLLASFHAFFMSFRAASGPALVAAPAAGVFLTVLSNILHAGSAGRFVDELSDSTNGWISTQLVYPLLVLGVVWLVLRRTGHLRPWDIGWRRSWLVPAFVATASFWLCMHGAFWLTTALGENRSGPPMVRAYGSFPASLTAQLFGNSLVEETLYRGFLFPQIYLFVARVTRRSVALAAALLASTALFALSHAAVVLQRTGELGAPERIQVLTEGLVWTFGFGLILALVFLVTRNLFLSVGLHAIWNAPSSVVDVSRESWGDAWWGCAVVLVIGGIIARAGTVPRQTAADSP